MDSALLPAPCVRVDVSGAVVILLEEEARDGLTWRNRMIDPSVGAMDERAARERFFEPMQETFRWRLATEIRREAGGGRVRQAPVTPPAGQMLPFEYRRMGRSAGASESLAPARCAASGGP